jgi:hypothetical protein
MPTYYKVLKPIPLIPEDRIILVDNGEGINRAVMLWGYHVSKAIQKELMLSQAGIEAYMKLGHLEYHFPIRVIYPLKV